MSHELKGISDGPLGANSQFCAQDQFLTADADQRDLFKPIPPPPEHFELLDPKILPRVPHPSEVVSASCADDEKISFSRTLLKKDGASVNSRSLLKDDKIESIFQKAVCLQDSEGPQRAKRVRFSDGLGPGDSSC
jgi:hypothetical protein